MRESWEEQTKANHAYWDWLQTTLDNVEHSDSVEFNLSGGLPWITVRNRDDLQSFLKLAPSWQKSTEGGRMRYGARVGDYDVVIFAVNSAIPPTCKVIVEEEIIPARAEERRMVERIVCEPTKVLL